MFLKEKIRVWRNNANYPNHPKPIPVTLLQTQLLDASNVVETCQITITRQLEALQEISDILNSTLWEYLNDDEVRRVYELLERELKDE